MMVGCEWVDVREQVWWCGKKKKGEERFSFFFQAESGKRDLVRSRWLGGGYKGQALECKPAT